MVDTIMIEVEMIERKDPTTTNIEFLEKIKKIIENTGVLRVVSAGGINFND